MNCENCKHSDVCKFKNGLYWNFTNSYMSEIVDRPTNCERLKLSLQKALAENCIHYEETAGAK